MPPNPRVCVGAAAVIRRGLCILLVQRGSRASYADGYGTWGLPGGWLEWGESAFDCARRETEEETGLVVSPVRQDGYTTTQAKTHSGLHVVTLFVICEYLGGIPRNLEHGKQLAVRWTPEEHMVELDLFAPLDEWWRRPR